MISLCLIFTSAPFSEQRTYIDFLPRVFPEWSLRETLVSAELKRPSFVVHMSIIDNRTPKATIPYLLATRPSDFIII